MARRKKPENETPEQVRERHILETVANNANRSEKTSWNRKMDNMVKLLSKLRPVEQKILDIMENEKQPILDDISDIRNVMMNECVHPLEYLVLKDNVVLCKFCNKRMAIPTNGK